jgi:predicted MFS family arabinose efflux permease
MVAHCTGMVDMVALPVWVGVLVVYYGMDAQRAGLMVTLFLSGAVLASLLLAPRFARLRVRTIVPVAYALAATAFVGLAQTRALVPLACLHALAGFCAGAGLSMTHGTIACSVRPHRLFAVVNIALGVFAIAFLGSTPPLIAATGGATLFYLFAGLMSVAAVVTLLAFPLAARQVGPATPASVPSLTPAVWWAVLGVCAMAVVQAMAFSFLERAASDRGVGVQAITAVLVAIGFVNLFPAALAALVEKRLPARRTLAAGPMLQGTLVFTAMTAASFAVFSVAASLFVAVMIFTHTFAFGLIARLDPTGRALAATPAMLMAGAAMGPILGGTLVKLSGYPALGVAALVIDAVALFAFLRLPARTVAESVSRVDAKTVAPQ